MPPNTVQADDIFRKCPQKDGVAVMMQAFSCAPDDAKIVARWTGREQKGIYDLRQDFPHATMSNISYLPGPPCLSMLK